MNTILQIACFRQAVVNYSFNFSVSAAVCRFNVSRASVYRWRSRTRINKRQTARVMQMTRAVRLLKKSGVLRRSS